MCRFIQLCLLLLAFAGRLSAEDFTAYVKHSSGLLMGNNGEGRTVLLEAKDAVPMRFAEAGDGWYTVELTAGAGAGQFLSKTGAWNASFVNSATADDARFRIEGDMAGLVKLICKSNNCCLGTDSNEAGANVYSDKSGSDAKYFWFITADKDAEPDVTTTRFTVDPKLRAQLNEGWGVSLCWWANMCGKWSDAKIDKLIDWLVSPTGLNYNIFRYNIGGGDDPENRNCTPHHMGSGKGLRAEMEGFKDFSGDDYHWERDAAQRKILLKIKEKRPDAIFEAFSNTPPWYMTYSGCCSGHEDGGQDNLKPECYEEFANYLVDVCKHYKEEYGIEFRSLEPFNEPATNYWHRSGGQEGCHFDTKSQIAFIKVLYPILKKSGLATFISAADETAVWPAICGFNDYKNAGILNMVGQWNTHTYYGNNGDRQNFNKLVRGVGKRLWMSETGSGGNGLQGNLSMAQRLIDDVRYIAPDAWVDWQYVEENNDQWCTVQGSFADQTYKRVKNYFVRQHFSRFIRQGYTYLSTTCDIALAAISPGADTIVVVTLNNSAAEQDFVVRLDNVEAIGDMKAYLTDATHSLSAGVKLPALTDGALAYTMPANSIETILITLPKEQDGVQAAKREPQLMSVGAADGTLIVNAPENCDVRVFSPQGVLLHRAMGSTSVALPSGIYLVSSAKGKDLQTKKIKL